MAIQPTTATDELQVTDSTEPPAQTGGFSLGQEDADVSAFLDDEEQMVSWLSPHVVKAIVKNGKGKNPLDPESPEAATLIKPSTSDSARAVNPTRPSHTSEPGESVPTLKGGVTDPLDKYITLQKVKLKEWPKVSQIEKLSDDEIGELADRNAATLHMADVRDFDETMSHQIPFHLVDSDTKMQGVRAALAESAQKEIDAARGAPVTHAQMEVEAEAELAKLAGEVDVPVAFLTDFMKRQSGGELPSRSEILATRIFLHKSGSSLKEQAWKIHNGESTPRDNMMFLSQWEFHKQLLAGYMSVRADWGRTGSVFRGTMTMPNPGEAVDTKQMEAPGVRRAGARRMEALVTAYAATMDLEKVVAQVLAMDDMGGLNKLVKAQATHMNKWGAAFTETFYTSILSGFGTQITNGLGGVAMIVKSAVDLQLAGMFGLFRPSGEKVYMGEAAAGLIGGLSSWRRMTGAAFEVFKTGNPYGGTQKFEQQGGKSVSADELLNRKNPNQSVLGKLINWAGHTQRFMLERVMGPIDALVSVYSEQTTLAHMAYRDMMDASANLDMSTPEGKAQAWTVLNRSLTEPSQRTIDDAVEMGEYNTFKGELGEWGKSMQKALNFPLLRMLAPFIKSPGNMFKIAWLESTPLGMLDKEWRDKAFPKAEFGPMGKDYAPGALQKAEIARSRLVFGVGVMSYFVTQAMAGRISGSGPRDYAQRKELEDSGEVFKAVTRRDDSGKIIESWKYEGYEPFGMIMGFAADLARVAEIGAFYELDATVAEKWQKVFGAGVLAITANSLDKGYMMGLHNAMKAVEDPDRAERWAANMINAVIPLSGARRDLRRLVDPVKRQTMDLTDTLLNSVPWLSKTLPPGRSQYGDSVKYSSFYTNRFEHKLIDQTPYMQEIVRLNNVTDKLVIGMPDKKIDGIELDAWQYDELVRLRDTPNIDGLDFKEELLALMGTEEYQASTDYEKAFAIKQMTSDRDSFALEALLSMPDEDMPGRLKHQDLVDRLEFREINRATVKSEDQSGRDEFLQKLERRKQTLGF